MLFHEVSKSYLLHIFAYKTEKPWPKANKKKPETIFSPYIWVYFVNLHLDDIMTKSETCLQNWLKLDI